MLFKSVPALAVLALAAHVGASEPMPYKPLMKMSIHQMFGVGRRQSDGYKPTESTCSDGATCAEACGAGFVTCASQDSMTHCFNPDIQQTCCPDNSGSKYPLALAFQSTFDANACALQTPAIMDTTARLIPRARPGAALTALTSLPVLLHTASLVASSRRLPRHPPPRLPLPRRPHPPN
jgi:hypothetical protein